MDPTRGPARPSRSRSPFFFQAEDGIRDWSVTGVQTCALPIYLVKLLETTFLFKILKECRLEKFYEIDRGDSWMIARSEERRVGKEGRSESGSEPKNKKEKQQEATASASPRTQT